MERVLCFPDRVALLGAIVGRKVRKARHFAVSAHRRSDLAKIDREAPPNGAFERSWGAKTRDVPKKTYKMVGKILDTHLLATLTRAVYANSPSQWVKSVITRYFFRTPSRTSERVCIRSVCHNLIECVKKPGSNGAAHATLRSPFPGEGRPGGKVGVRAREAQ